MRPASILWQVFGLVLFCVTATLALGLSVVALSTPPAPKRTSIDAFIRSYQGKDGLGVSVSRQEKPPPFATMSTTQPEKLIVKSLADGLARPITDVKVVMATPALFGLVPRSEENGPGEMTIIDVPPDLTATVAPFDMSKFLRNDVIRVPPFFATIRESNGTWSVLSPTGKLDTLWNLRLVAIFILALLAAAPLAWFGAHRWTRAIRLLARRMSSAKLRSIAPPVCRPGDAAEIAALEREFEQLHARITRQIGERTTLLVAVAHDLRTPLTSLRVRLEDVAPELRSGMLRDVERVTKMTDSVLAFASAEGPTENREVVELDGMIRDALADTHMPSDRVSLDLEPLTAVGSRMEFARIADNLVQNASRYGEHIRISLSSSHGIIELRVEDDGPGVPDDLLPRLTEPFFRVDRSRNTRTGGVGLGLATTKNLVEKLGGRLLLRNLSPGFAAVVRFPHDLWGEQAPKVSSSAVVAENQHNLSEAHEGGAEAIPPSSISTRR